MALRDAPPRQLASCEAAVSDEAFQQNAARHRFRLEEVDIGDITFREGQAEPVHRWYRLTPSFAPGLVRFFLDSWEVGPQHCVFDPFAGRGTTAIECQLRGVPSLSYEINPLLARVIACSLRWRPRRSRLIGRYLDEVARRCAEVSGLEPEVYCESEGVRLPAIHDVFRWWRPPVLRELLVARETARAPVYRRVGQYLWLAVNAAALDCANIHRNHPTITFDDGHDRKIDVLAELDSKLVAIQADLRGLGSTGSGRSNLGRVALHDSCAELKLASGGQPRVTHAITSPPYPNRYSYVHQTRPQLYFMEVISSRTAATEIDLATVGGTWGRATSDLAKEPVEPPARLRPFLDYYDELSARSPLMCSYATKYFVDMAAHVEALRRGVARGFRGAYVVGNSRLSGVEIYTETILARIFEACGFEVERILLFRRRGGKRRLYETAVCLRG